MLLVIEATVVAVETLVSDDAGCRTDGELVRRVLFGGVDVVVVVFSINADDDVGGVVDGEYGTICGSGGVHDDDEELDTDDEEPLGASDDRNASTDSLSGGSCGGCAAVPTTAAAELLVAAPMPAKPSACCTLAHETRSSFDASTAPAPTTTVGTSTALIRRPLELLSDVLPLLSLEPSSSSSSSPSSSAIVGSTVTNSVSGESTSASCGVSESGKICCQLPDSRIERYLSFFSASSSASLESCGDARVAFSSRFVAVLFLPLFDDDDDVDVDEPRRRSLCERSRSFRSRFLSLSLSFSLCFDDAEDAEDAEDSDDDDECFFFDFELDDASSGGGGGGIESSTTTGNTGRSH